MEEAFHPCGWKESARGIIIRVNVTLGSRGRGIGADQSERVVGLSVSGPARVSRASAHATVFTSRGAKDSPDTPFNRNTVRIYLGARDTWLFGHAPLPSPSGPYWIFDGPAIYGSSSFFHPLFFRFFSLSFPLFVPIHFAIWSDYPMCVPTVGVYTRV